MLSRKDMIMKLRVRSNNHIRPIRIKNECEFCGASDDLVLHHVDSFSDLLDKCFIMLGIEIYRDTFSKEEYEKIKHMLLGMEMTCGMATLCESCHKEVHKDGFEKAKTLYNEFMDGKKRITLEVVNELKSFLKESFEKNEYYDKDDFRDTINKIIDLDRNLEILLNKLDGNRKTRNKGMKVYNKLFEELELSYIVDSKKITLNGVRKNYWFIKKKDSNDIAI